MFELDFTYMMKVVADENIFVDNTSVDRHFELRRICRSIIEPAGASCEEKSDRGKFFVSISNFA